MHQQKQSKSSPSKAATRVFSEAAFHILITGKIHSIDKSVVCLKKSKTVHWFKKKFLLIFEPTFSCSNFKYFSLFLAVLCVHIYKGECSERPPDICSGFTTGVPFCFIQLFILIHVTMEMATKLKGSVQGQSGALSQHCDFGSPSH